VQDKTWHHSSSFTLRSIILWHENRQDVDRFPFLF
jgi:hypothetical protein